MLRLAISFEWKKKGIRLLFASLLMFPIIRSVAAGLPAEESEPRYCSPGEIKLSHDGRKMYVVCEDADSLLVMDVRTGRVMDRVKVGHKPRDVAVAPDGKTLYVSNEWDDTVSVIDALSLKARESLNTGWGPIGLTTDRTGKTLYVANSIGDDVSVIDLARKHEIKRLAAWRSPHYVALSADGRRIYVSNLMPLVGPPDQEPVSELTVIDASRNIVRERVRIPGAIELRHIAESRTAESSYLLVPLLRPKNLNPLIEIPQGGYVTHGVSVIKIHATGTVEDERSAVTEILLDDIDRYFAGTNGAAFTPDGRYALVSSSEANILTVIDARKLQGFLRAAPPGDLPNRLDSAQAFVARRIPVGFEPISVVVSGNGKFAYVANRLEDTISVIDLARFEVASTIQLERRQPLTQLRRGERLFHDASFSFQGQLACATCHPDNHEDGIAWNLETPQLGRDRVLNRTLRGIAETAPFKWNGHNADLQTQGGPRAARFIFHSEGFSHDQLEDLVAFIKSIPLAPNRHLAPSGRLSPAQQRGRTKFFERSCNVCHPAETHYTAKTTVDVGTAARHDTSGLFDIPQLERIYERPPYLHGGQALTLEEIWTKFNVRDRHGVTTEMTKQELNDLIEFLKTL